MDTYKFVSSSRNLGNALHFGAKISQEVGLLNDDTDASLKLTRGKRQVRDCYVNNSYNKLLQRTENIGLFGQVETVEEDDDFQFPDVIPTTEDPDGLDTGFEIAPLPEEEEEEYN